MALATTKHFSKTTAGIQCIHLFKRSYNSIKCGRLKEPSLPSFHWTTTLLKYKTNNFHRTFSTNGVSEARKKAEYEEGVLSKLREVKLKDGSDLVTKGLIRNLKVDPERGTVRFAFLSNDAWLQELCVSKLQELDWIKEIPILEHLSPLKANAASDKTNGLDNVRNIVAVSSCKGGVGKSTISVNLACSLKLLGYKTGIVDADVYGPSLPRMLVSDQEGWSVTRSADKTMINPLRMHGLQCMSYGFVAPGTGGRGTENSKKGLESNAAILRGPMVSKIITQLCVKTMWDDLDYLIIDMPPGTGDIHLTICQELKRIDAAVIVTTPQQLSFIDVIKGIDMFSQLKVPTIAVVENMSYFVGDDGRVYKPFGPGNIEELKRRYGIKDSFSLPISPETSNCGDSGMPYVLEHQSDELSNTYRKLAQGVVEEVESMKSVASSSYLPKLSYSERRGGIVVRFFESDTAKEYVIKPIEFRRKLNKVDEMLKIDLNAVPDSIYPVEIHPKGNYAVSIKWSDGHEDSIYPYSDIQTLCEELER